MTEKRFKLGYVCGDFGLIVNDEWIDLHSMSESSEKNVQICINKMNELAEENQDLKSFNKDLAENLSVCANARISKDNHIEKLEKENNEIKQLIHTMLVQMEVEKINTENARYWAGIIFRFEEFQKMREIWKGDF